MVEQVPERYEMHRIGSVGATGLVKPVYLSGRASVLLMEGHRFNPGRRHERVGHCCHLNRSARVRPEGAFVAALAKQRVQFHQKQSSVIHFICFELNRSS